jgi:hypothetical protein
MKEPTFGQMDKVLRRLGFMRRNVKLRTEALVYEHQDTGALILLPASPARKRVLPHHLAAVQGTLKEYGIANPLDLAANFQMAS